VIVVREDSAATDVDSYLSVVYVGRFTRARLDRFDWASVSTVTELLRTPGAVLNRAGRAGALAALDVSADPDLAVALAAVRIVGRRRPAHD
jgi:hypothetical protein